MKTSCYTDSQIMATLKQAEAGAPIAQLCPGAQHEFSPSLQEAAQKVQERRRVSIRVVCVALGISESCYHYQPKLSGENELIAECWCG